MLTIKFRTAAVTISKGIVTAIFADGTKNEMNTNWLDLPWYKKIAEEHGFKEDWRFYALTHELTHHWLADKLAWRWSWAVHDNVDYGDPASWPEPIAWEEHLVNKLQRYVMTGELDRENVLVSVFGRDKLPDLRLGLVLLYARLK